MKRNIFPIFDLKLFPFSLTEFYCKHFHCFIRREKIREKKIKIYKRMEYLSDEGYRFDGRKPNEFRMIKGRLGVFDHADGSVKGIDHDS